MKVTGRAIAGFLANPPAEIAAVLLYGHDRGLIHEHSARLARQFVPDLNDPFSVTRLDADTIAKDPALLIDSAAAMPPMGGRRLVLVSDAGGTIADACKTLLASPPPESLTIITASDSINTRSALVKLFEGAGAGASIGCYLDTDQSLAVMAQTVFRDAQIKVDRDAMNWIVDHLGADRMASRQEVEKLVLLAGTGGQLDLAAVQHALGDGAAITANDIVHAAASGNITALSTALDRASADALEGERVIRSAIGYFSRLFRIGAAMEAGMARDAAMKSVRPPVNFMEQRQVEAHLRFWSPGRCRRAIDRLAEAELQSRKGVPAEMASAQALVSLAQAARR